MSEKEKQMIIKFLNGLPYLKEYDKGYFLGVAETRALAKEAQEKETTAAG